MQTQNREKEKPQTDKAPIITRNTAPDWPAGIVVSKKASIDVSIAKDLAVILTANAFEQLFGWAYSTHREISCLGSVSRDGNRFIIEKFFLLKQSGTSASTELDESAIASFMEQLIAEGRKEEAGRIKCWAHSHPNMGVFWSGTDNETCRLLVNDYLISIVVSNNFVVRCRIDIAAPLPVVLDNIPVLYQIPRNKSEMGKYTEEVKQAVLEKPLFLPKEAGTQDRAEDMLVPEQYCCDCGNWHAEGQCPLGDIADWPNSDNEDFTF